jgi:hypothetical protein
MKLHAVTVLLSFFFISLATAPSYAAIPRSVKLLASDSDSITVQFNCLDCTDLQPSEVTLEGRKYQKIEIADTGIPQYMRSGKNKSGSYKRSRAFTFLRRGMDFKRREAAFKRLYLNF